VLLNVSICELMSSLMWMFMPLLPVPKDDKEGFSEPNYCGLLSNR
jgi:hypothetical protein